MRLEHILEMFHKRERLLRHLKEVQLHVGRSGPSEAALSDDLERPVDIVHPAIVARVLKMKLPRQLVVDQIVVMIVVFHLVDATASAVAVTAFSTSPAHPVRFEFPSVALIGHGLGDTNVE